MAEKQQQYESRHHIDSADEHFIFQEHTSDGRQSNFFRLENPDREDA